MKISIIIPVIDESANIESLIKHLTAENDAPENLEIIIVDGGSKDNSCEIARNNGAIVVEAGRPGRAFQMNLGAKKATGEILYFVHADTRPPQNYAQHILESIDEKNEFGCFRVKFKTKSLGLKMNSYMSRFRGIYFRGGDETLFITKSLFDKIGGFREDYFIMEDYEIIMRLRKQSNYRIVPDYVWVSDRKVQENSYFRANAANVLIFFMFFAGFSQQKMVNTYTRLVKGTRFKLPSTPAASQHSQEPKENTQSKKEPEKRERQSTR